MSQAEINESAPAASANRAELPLFVVLFFCSGAAGLIYEVLWMRQFGHVMGNTTISLSAVLTAFMGGLAIGSWIGGRIADRIASRTALYGVLEILIGLCALAIPAAIRAIEPWMAALYRADPNGWALPVARFALATAIMLAPTILMGATLPLLIRHFTEGRETVGQKTGLLYGINTVGAMFGALAAGFYLIPALGMRATNWIAASINFAVGVLAIGLALAMRKSAASANAAAEARPAADEEHVALPAGAGAVLIGIAIAGAAAMIYQVCWTRLFALLIGSSTYSFSIVVSITIGGLALGGVMLGRWVDRVRSPILFFATLQLLIALACFAVAYFSPNYPYYAYQTITRHAQTAHIEQTSVFGLIMFQEFGFVGFLLIVPTFLMGGVFPAAARARAASQAHLGREIGKVYAVNTIGAVAGSLAGALALMHWLGLMGAMLVAVGLNLLAALWTALAARREPRLKRVGLSAATLAAAVAAALFPPEWDSDVMTIGAFMVDRIESNESTTAKTFREASRKASDLLFYQDGIAGTVTVRQSREPISALSLAINGKPEASDSTMDMQTQVLCGHLGSLLRPGGKTGMVIGMGSGVTLSGMLAHESFQRVDMIEINPAVAQAVRAHFGHLNDYALDDPRTNLVLADGRNHIALTDRKYDQIASVPSNPWMAGIANLFTREFFEMCRDRLTDEGVMCQWIHTYNLTFADFMMVVRTFMDVMDHGMIWQTNLGDFLLIGSKTPIVVDFERLRRDVEADSRISRHLAKAHLNDIRALMGDFMARKEHLVEMEAYRAAETNIDDSCRLEFTAPIAYYNYLKQVQPAQIAELRSDPSDLFDPATLPKEMAELFALVPQARRLEASGLDLARQGNPAALAARMYEAYTMYPYDISLAFLAVDACRGMVEFNRATLTAQKALQWLVQACKIYETVGHAPDPMMMAGIMYQGRKIALHINDKESAAYFEGLMERLGGPDLLSKMQEIDNTLSAAHESDEAA